jgi:hypothetical protein
MANMHTTFIGIDLSASPGKRTRTFTGAALDKDLKLIAVWSGDRAAMLAYTAGQQEAVVAVNAPRCPNRGLMQQPEFRQKLDPPPDGGGWSKARAAEYLVGRHNIPIPATPGQAEEAPTWMQNGFDLFARLEGSGYRAYPAEGAPRQSLEVQTTATFTALLGQPPYGRDTLEGRMQRQLVLSDLGVKIYDPMDFFEEVTRHKLLHSLLPLDKIHTGQELDALAAAYTAWLAATKPGEVIRLGEPEEGEIVLPVKALKDSY